MATAISVNNLRKSYGRTRALDGLTLSVERGEFLGFLGPNGAGKTTTIRILTGVIRPDAGEVAVGNYSPHQRREVARLIGVVPESRGFYNWMTAFEYLEFFARLYSQPRAGLRRAASDLLAQVGLSSVQDSRIGTFSRGMRQRLGLARALVNRPEILFLDEPTLGLDPQGQKDIQDHLRRLNAEGVTVFISSHLLHEVANLCSRIAIINHGSLVVAGTLDELRQRAGLKAGYRVLVGGDARTIDFGPLAGRITRRGGSPTRSELILEGTLAEANRLLDLLRGHGLPMLEFGPVMPDLSDVFLALTGRNNQP